MSNSDNGRLNFSTGIDNSSMRADAAQSRGILEGISKTAVKEGENIDKVFSRLGKTIVGVFSVQQAAAFARQVVTIRGEIESLEKSFENLAGKSQGRKLFGDIRDFAVKTPMAMRDLAKGAQTLLAFNVAAQDVMPLLRNIGDIAMGDAQKFNSLTLAFSQMQSASRLMGQDLLQMINAGFNPLAVISEKTGKSIGELKKEMEAGSVSADMVRQAFKDAASEGGKFYGMLETQSKGVKGSLSNLEGAIEEMFNKIGENAEGVITGSIKAATELVNSYERVGEIIGELVAAYGVYRAALIALTAAKSFAAAVNSGLTASEVLHYNTLLLVEKAQRLLNATILKNPYVLAASAVAALSYGLYKLVIYQTDAEKAQAKLNDATRRYNKDIAAEQVQIDRLFARLKAAREGTDEYKTAKQSILNQFGDYLKGLGLEVQSLHDVEGAYKAVTIAARDAARARALDAATKEAADTYAGKEAEAKEALYRALKARYGEEKGADGMSVAETYYWQILGTLSPGAKKKVKSDFLKEFDITHVGQSSSTVGGGTGTVYTTNAVKAALEEIRKAKEIFDNTMSEANRLFGARPLPAAEEAESGGKPSDVVKNKKYWEEYKKEQQGLLDAMTAAQLKTEEAAEVRANISEAQKNIDAYSVTNGASAANRVQKEENQIAVQTAERNEKIRQYGESVAREARQAELDIEQARVDGMKEGLEKELAQNELNYQRLIEANLRRQEGMVEALRDKMQLEWENANPKAKERGRAFDRGSVTAADLSPEQLHAIKEYGRIAGELRAKADKESLERALSDFMTYEEKRVSVAESYARKRRSMYVDGDEDKGFRSGFGQGNRNELDEQERKAIAAIDEQFAQREASYQAWCDAVAALSLEQLTGILEQAEAELKKLEESGEADGKQIAVARAKAAAAKSKVEKAGARNDLSPGKRSVEQWNALRESLDDCRQSFVDIGEAVGGVAGKIISAAGGIMSSSLSMINGIIQLANASSAGIAGAAAAASKAVSTVEKASVILTVITAAVQTAAQIADLFSGDEGRQAEIEALQERIEQLQWELENTETVRLRGSSAEAMETLARAAEQAREEFLRLQNQIRGVSESWGEMAADVAQDNALMQRTAELVAKAYANIAYTADKALGAKRYEEATEKLKNLAEQQLLIQQEIDVEYDKKEIDYENIERLEREIEEKGAQAVALINDIVEGIIGGSAADIAAELGDAFFEAFKNGEDYAAAWGDKVNDIVGDITKRMLVSRFLEKPLGEIFNKYKDKWFKDNKFVGLDAVVDSMSGFAADLNAAKNDFAAVWESLPGSVKELFTAADSEREASRGGIASASQESVDELNGRATAIQGHTYSISEYTRQLAATANSILESVLNIENETYGFGTRLERMEDSLHGVKEAIEDIALKGIKIQ